MTSLTRSPLSRSESQSERQTASLAALAVTLLLVVIGLYLIEALRLQASMQDCVLSGRSGCAVLILP